MKCIAIAGVSGAGKSDLTRALAQHFSAPSCAFDEFEHVVDDVAIGGNPNVDALFRVRSPALGMAVRAFAREQPRYVFVEAPLGYAHSDLRALLDLVIGIDLPLELALARRLLRYWGQTRTDSQIVRAVRADLDAYASEDRALQLAVQQSVRTRSDLVLDGSAARDQLLAQALSYIEDRA